MYSRKRYFRKHALIMLCCCGRSGIDYSVKTLTLDNAQVAMQLWDTAGQERRVYVLLTFFALYRLLVYSF